MWILRLPGESAWRETGRVSSGAPDREGWGPEGSGLESLEGPSGRDRRPEEPRRAGSPWGLRSRGPGTRTWG